MLGRLQALGTCVGQNERAQLGVLGREDDRSSLAPRVPMSRRHSIPKQVRFSTQELTSFHASERASTVGRELYRAKIELLELRSDRDRFADAALAIDWASDGFNRTKRLAYLEPERARRRNRESTITDASARVADWLRQETQRFRALRAEEERRAVGLLVPHDNSKASGATNRRGRSSLR
jgi:hypothetical protein